MLTVPQAGNPCRNHAIIAITESPDALSIREIRARMERFRPYLQRDVRETLEELTEEGVLDFEQPHSKVKFYFLASRPPRRYVRHVPAAIDAPPEAVARGSWVSSLAAGGAAPTNVTQMATPTIVPGAEWELLDPLPPASTTLSSAELAALMGFVVRESPPCALFALTSTRGGV